jgi:hypothetical protein
MLNRVFYGGSIVALVAAIAAGNLFSAEDNAKRGQDEVQHYRAKQLLGAKVGLEGNRSVGTIDDIVLDENGNVDYLIVLTGQDKLVTVPWDATRFDIEKRMATVQIQQDQFQQVPTYTAQQYPTFAAPTYRTQIYKYYGLTPGQQRRAIRRGAVSVQ